MSKILLIKPAYETDAVWDTVRTSQPLGLWWIGSELKERGHEVRLMDETVRAGGLERQILFSRTLRGENHQDTPLDETYQKFVEQKMADFATMNPHEFVRKYSAFHGDEIRRTMVRTGVPLEDTLAEVAKANPDYVGIPVFASCNYPAALTLARAIKQQNPATRIVFGGQHVTALPQQVLNSGVVDHIVVGDAVRGMTELVDAGKGPRTIVGGVASIDEFPLLDMELIAENQYPVVPTHTYQTGGRRSIDYMFSKGCYRDCDFCVAGRKENKISKTRFERIDKQLQRFRDYGFTEIVVQDDAFLFKPQENLREYLALMKNHGMFWQDNGGIEFESCTPQVIDMFLNYQTKGEGRINSLYVPLNPRTGHEPGSVVSSFQKRHGAQFSHIKQLRESGIYVCTSEIIGYPGQTMQTMEEDIALHQALVNEGIIDKSMTFVTSTLPGTKLHDENHQNIINPNDWPGYSNFVPQSRTNVVADPREIERITVQRNQGMNAVQTSYSWGSTFAND